MKKIGDYDLFFDFFMFQSKLWVGIKKNVTIPKLVTIFKRENFLNIRKNCNRIKGAEKKDHWLTNFRFFASLWKKKLLNPRCARYAWGQDLVQRDVVGRWGVVILCRQGLAAHRFDHVFFSCMRMCVQIIIIFF
jgi:hypothetical protein